MNLPGYTPTPALSGLSNVNALVGNRFDKYKSPYTYEDMKTFLDQIYGTYENQINQQASDATADLTGDATQRMASRGITGGSVVEDTLSGIGSKVNKNKLNVLSNLGASKAGQNLNLMDLFNTRDFATQKAATDVDLSNVGNQLSQAQAIASAYLQNRGMDIQEESQPGFLEDLFSGIGDFASLIPGLDALGLFGKKNKGGIAPIDI
jgi:hypothetical protein